MKGKTYWTYPGGKLNFGLNSHLYVILAYLRFTLPLYVIGNLNMQSYYKRAHSNTL
nr:hypothetical protein Q903MT_gene56 [Picea sitchensis]